MYKEYWGLSERPFENTADPAFGRGKETIDKQITDEVIREYV